MSRRKRYSAEFEREAIRRANEKGVTDVLVAEELSSRIGRLIAVRRMALQYPQVEHRTRGQA